MTSSSSKAPLLFLVWRPWRSAILWGFSSKPRHLCSYSSLYFKWASPEANEDRKVFQQKLRVMYLPAEGPSLEEEDKNIPSGMMSMITANDSVSDSTFLSCLEEWCTDATSSIYMIPSAMPSRMASCLTSIRPSPPLHLNNPRAAHTRLFKNWSARRRSTSKFSSSQSRLLLNLCEILFSHHSTMAHCRRLSSYATISLKRNGTFRLWVFSNREGPLIIERRHP